ncbi:MAG: radical SAM family heme chaperone HemW [Ruminococcus sp.]|jgi:oxygen-independent coproporphyrinogen-3 oxidase
MEKKIELYLHIPFCVKKCDYCDFLSGRGSIKEQNDYCEAMLQELSAVSFPEDTAVSSIFIGGGTPTVIDSEWIVCFMERIRNRFSVEDDAEITIEANPGTLSENRLKDYRRAGINRLSIGLQSADNRELALLGRIHTYEEFLENYKRARTVGFDNVNVDLMMAIPGQDRSSLMKTLSSVTALRPEHLSLYSLIVEPGTPFAERKLDLPGEDEEREMYEEAVRFLEEWGYRQYEISNFAKAGRECRHNLGYWQRVPYRGFGLGAASLVDEVRFSNTSDMKEYLRDCRKPKLLQRDREVLGRKEQMEEFMFLGLRMRSGVEKKKFEEKFGCSLDEVYGKTVARYCSMGFLEEKEGRVFLTGQGISVSNVILSDFLL